MYKTVVVKYSPKAKEIATRIEEAAIMPSSKGILVFKKSGAPEPEK